LPALRAGGSALGSTAMRSALPAILFLVTALFPAIADAK
jgi:hypothetical protein